MGKNYFEFKHFVVHQERAAMKVGTDGTLLGAWAEGGNHVLDIGTGTGLIALMIGQRYPEAQIDAIDIDKDACWQATENVKASPYCGRITVHHSSIQHFADISAQRYDAIICNPPFFERALKNPDKRKTIARHTDSMEYGELFSAVARLLEKENGIFSVIIPTDCRSRFDEEAVYVGLFSRHVLSVKTKYNKPPKRYLLSYSFNVQTSIESQSLILGDEKYKHLVDDFYLHK